MRDVGLTEEEVGESGSWITVEKMFMPPVEKEAEILTGGVDEIATKIVETLRAKGLI